LDEFDPDFPFFFGYGAGEVHGLFSGKVVPPFGDSKHGAFRAEEIRIGNLISHDAPGYGGDGLLMLKRSLALQTLDHLPLSLLIDYE